MPGVAASQITRICLTHVHGDHCYGLPGVLSRMALDGVAHPVHLHYPASGEDVVRALVSVASPGIDLRLHPHGGGRSDRARAWRYGPCTTASRPTATGSPSPTAAPSCRTGWRRPGLRDPTSAACSARKPGRGAPGGGERAAARTAVRLRHGHGAVRRRRRTRRRCGPAGGGVHLQRRRRRAGSAVPPPHGGPGRRPGGRRRRGHAGAHPLLLALRRLRPAR